MSQFNPEHLHRFSDKLPPKVKAIWQLLLGALQIEQEVGHAIGWGGGRKTSDVINEALGWVGIDALPTPDIDANTFHSFSIPTVSGDIRIIEHDLPGGRKGILLRANDFGQLNKLRDLWQTIISTIDFPISITDKHGFKLNNNKK